MLSVLVSSAFAVSSTDRRNHSAPASSLPRGSFVPSSNRPVRLWIGWKDFHTGPCVLKRLRKPLEVVRDTWTISNRLIVPIKSNYSPKAVTASAPKYHRKCTMISLQTHQNITASAPSFHLKRTKFTARAPRVTASASSSPRVHQAGISPQTHHFFTGNLKKFAAQLDRRCGRLSYAGLAKSLTLS